MKVWAIDLPLPSERVTRTLDQIIEWRGKSCSIRCDNGSEYISAHMKAWRKKRGIELMYIEPGKPTQNAYIERFNRTVREALLNAHEFENIAKAQEMMA